MLTNSAWFAVTSLGSSGLMLPAAAIVAGRLVMARGWRVGIWWLGVFGGAVCVVLASKLAFLGWGIGVRSLDFTGISGHAMLATAVLPAFACLLIPPGPARSPTPAVVFGLALGFAVGMSRLVLEMHSLSEVAAGLGLGALVAATFIKLVGSMERPALNSWLAVTLLIPVVAFHHGYGNRTDTHELIVKAALLVSGRGHPYSRIEWGGNFRTTSKKNVVSHNTVSPKPFAF